MDSTAIDLQIDSKFEGPWAILGLRGEVDIYTSPKLKEAIVELLDSGKARLIIDMSEVDFIDSSGLGVLIGGLKRVREQDGEMTLVVSTSESIKRLLGITGMDRVFTVHQSLEDSLRK